MQYVQVRSQAVLAAHHRRSPSTLWCFVSLSEPPPPFHPTCAPETAFCTCTPAISSSLAIPGHPWKHDWT